MNSWLPLAALALFVALVTLIVIGDASAGEWAMLAVVAIFLWWIGGMVLASLSAGWQRLTEHRRAGDGRDSETPTTP